MSEWGTAAPAEAALRARYDRVLAEADPEILSGLRRFQSIAETYRGNA